VGDSVIVARPMKGIAPRGSKRHEDDRLRARLAHSEKEQAKRPRLFPYQRDFIAMNYFSHPVDTYTLRA